MKMKVKLSSLLLVSLIASGFAQYASHNFGKRSVIVHLFEWKFSDIALECERWLGPQGYGGVQVSPVNEHIILPGRPWMERYQPVSYKIQTRSGNREDFLNMTRRCNANGVRIYVDVVINHMTSEIDKPLIVGTANSEAYPYNYDYPAVPYTREDFHNPCPITNWNHPDEMRNCAMFNLQDLNHTSPHVQDTIADFLNELIELGVGGFQIDSAKHIWPDELELIMDSLDDLNIEFGFPEDARPFVYLNMVDFGSQRGELGRYEYLDIGLVTEFLIPGELGRAFAGYNDLKWLDSWGPQWNYLPTGSSIVFVDNHEFQRGYGQADKSTLTYKQPKLYKMASAFVLAHPYGRPRVMSSYEFVDAEHGPPVVDDSTDILSPFVNGDGSCGNGWICEHRWPGISNMVRLRNEAYGTGLNNWWDNGQKHIAFSRGESAFVAWNGEINDLDEDLQTCLPAGVYCDVITGELRDNKCTGTEVTVNEHGVARIFIDGLSPNGVLAIHTASVLGNQCPGKSLIKMFNMFANTTCFKHSRLHIDPMVIIGRE